MEGLSIEELLNGLQAAQQKKTTVRLSERNVVELVNKLRELGILGDDLLHTSNGRYYLTRAQLQKEAAAAIASAGGRLPLVDLPTALGVDLAHCERAAAELVSAPNSTTIQAQGELLTPQFFDALADDVNEALQASGVVAVGDLARRFGLGVEMLAGVLRERIQSCSIEGKLESGVLYTDVYLQRLKAQLRGALRGALAPVSLAALRNELGVESLGALDRMVPSLIEEIAKAGEAAGKLVAGGSWVPAAHARSQQDAVKSFFQQNGFVAYSAAAKQGVASPAEMLTAAFPDGIALGAAFVSPALALQVEAAVEEALHGSTWCDVMLSLPGEVAAADAAQLLAGCGAVKGAGGGLSVLSETCAVSVAFLDAMRRVLCEEAERRAREAHAEKAKSSKAAGGGAGAGGGGSVAAGGSGKGGKKAAQSGKELVAAADSDDDDWSTGKKGGKKVKGGKGRGGGSGGGKVAAKSQPQLQGAKSKASAAAADAPIAVSAASLSLEALEKRVTELHPDTEGAGADGDLPAAIAAEVRQAVVAAYERALSDIFTAGAERRRRLREAATTRLDTSYQTLRLQAKGAELFADDDATAAVLQRHLLRTAAPLCVDALMRLLGADLAETTADAEQEGLQPRMPEEIAAAPYAPAERAAAVREAPAEVQSPLGEAVSTLAGAATDPFFSALESAAEAVGVRLKRPDKKSEAAAVAAQLEALRGQAEGAGDGPTLLAVAVPALIAKHRGRSVSLPGRALGAAVELLKVDLGEEGHAALAAFHAAVVEQLKRGGEGGAGGDAAEGENGKRMEGLDLKVRAMVAG